MPAYLFFLLVFFSPLSLTASPEPFAYSIVLEGIPAALKKTLSQSAHLFHLKKREISSPSKLRYLLEDKTPELIQILHTEGYYDAKISWRKRKTPQKTYITLDVYAGPQYRLKDFSITMEGKHPLLKDPLAYCQKLGIEKDIPARAKTLLHAQSQISKLLTSYLTPQARVRRKVFVNKVDKSSSWELIIDQLEPSFFGPLSIKGLKEIPLSLVETLIAWKEGEAYQSALIRKTRESLEKTQLFTLISLQSSSQIQNSLPISLELSEGKRHSIESSFSFAQEQRLGTSLAWERRNAFGKADNLSLKGEWNEKKHLLGLAYTRPFFDLSDQEFEIEIKYEQQTTDSYTESIGQVESFLYQYPSPRLERRYGFSIEDVRSKENEVRRHYELFELSHRLIWMQVPFDLKGYFLKIDSTFAISKTDSWTPFIRSSCFLAKYIDLGQTKLKIWTHLGSLWRASREEIPPSQRFYGGSKQALAGYKYRTVSPLDAQNKALGGLSICTFGAECRLPIKGKWTLIPFYEIGHVDANRRPRLSKYPLHSTGCGLSMESGLGPLSLTFAFPLNRRPSIDSHFEMYISIGREW